MGQKISRILIIITAVLVGLIILIFFLNKLGVGGGIAMIVLFLAATIAFAHRFGVLSRFFKKRGKRKGQRRLPAGASGSDFAFLRSGVRIADKASGTLPTFNDVAGLEEAKESLKEVVDILKNPKAYLEIGEDVSVPKGVLMMGPPGTGKTLLARATAGEADVAFLWMSGSEFVELYVGVGASRVRDLFREARSCADEYGGAIVFLDEIDAVGKRRDVTGFGGHDERGQTLTQIFTEMDGFEKDTNIVVMAATNQPEVLDPALTRRGRFDRHIVIDRPDRNARREILKIHTRKKKLAEDIDLDAIAGLIPGFSGADIKNLCNEAALFAARQKKTKIEMSDFEEAVGIVTVGQKRKSKKISEAEKMIAAYHESGHALVAELLPEIDPLRRVSIVPSGVGTGGYTQVLPKEDRYLYTRDFLFAQVKLYLAGRVAEEVNFGPEKISTGAENDLREATKLVLSIICDFGMSQLGPGILGEKEQSLFLGQESLVRHKTYSEKTAEAIDEEKNRIFNESYKETKHLILTNRSKLDALATALLKYEELDGKEAEKIIEKS